MEQTSPTCAAKYFPRGCTNLSGDFLGVSVALSAIDDGPSGQGFLGVHRATGAHRAAISHCHSLTHSACERSIYIAEWSM